MPWLLLTVALLFSSSVRALDEGQLRKNVRFERIMPPHGLSQGSVHAIAQDRQGFLWFGTQEGLNRYDGYGFTVFRNEPGRAGTLPHDWVSDLLLARDGLLWVATNGGGLGRIDPATGAISHLGVDDGLSSSRLRVLHQDRSGMIWIGTEDGGLNRVDPRTGEVAVFRHADQDPHSLGADRVLAILEDREGRLWIGTDGGGLDRFDRASGRFIHHRHDPADTGSLSSDRVRALLQDRLGNLWVGTWEGGLNRYDPAADRFVRYRHRADDPHSLSHDRVRALFQDRGGTLWVGTDAGLNQWVPQYDGFIRYGHDPADLGSLSDERVTTLFQDRGGVLWVGTYNGLNHWNYASAAFAHYRQEGGEPGSLSSNVVTSFAEESDGTLWVGTYGGGLNRMGRADEQFTHLRHDPDDPASLSDDRVMALFVDAGDNLWVGTRSGGLDLLPAGKSGFRHFRHDPDDPASISADGITTIYGDTDGTLWVGTYGGGLNHLDPATGRFVSYRHDPDDPRSLSSNRVLAVYRDRLGTLWVGTEDGYLNRYEPPVDGFVRIGGADAGASGLTTPTVWEIQEDRNGDLWLGTLGGGVYRWAFAERRQGREVFTRYTRNEGLSSNVVYGVVEDESGRFWLSTNRGINRLDPATRQVRVYDTFHGLQGDDFNLGARLRSRQGRIFFGGANGFNAFYPARVAGNPHPPQVQLTGLWVLNQPRVNEFGLPRLPAAGEPLELGYRDYLVTFEFTALDFSAPARNRFRYRLEGFDSQWIDTDTFRRATYTNLPAGDYVFRVLAANNDGVWSEQGIALPIHVNPPPWRSWWAHILYVLLVGTLLLAWWRIVAARHARELRYRIELEAEVALRTQELESRNSQLQRLNLRLQEASLTDSFTGLKNRRFLYTQIGQELAQVHRELEEAQRRGADGNFPGLFFMMVDLDGFKPVNDTYGHEAGDRVLLQVRDLLVKACRQSDMLIRWGGDEFLIVAHSGDPQAAEHLAERIREGIADHPYDIGNHETVEISCSIGFAFYPFLPTDPSRFSWEQVTAVADRALYLVKGEGRNGWAGILANRGAAEPDLFAQIHRDPFALAEKGVIRILSSFPDLRRP